MLLLRLPASREAVQLLVQFPLELAPFDGVHSVGDGARARIYSLIPAK